MPKDFFILSLENDFDRRQWLEIWNLWSNKEVFAHPDYAGLYLSSGARGKCAVLKSDYGVVMYPFVCRDLTIEPFGDIGVSPLFDTVTPYGYGGHFISKCSQPQKLALEFRNYFDNWAEENNIVCEVIKFSLFPDTLLPYVGVKEQKLRNVIVDLILPENELWMDFEHKVRKNVKKAKRNNVEIYLDPTGKRIADFLVIYQNMLIKRGAKSSYNFGEQFFENIHQKLPGQFMYFYALHNNEPISAELVLVSQENVYSFLGGTLNDKLSLSPNDLLKYEIILWAKKIGKKRLVLGGGYEDGDGIFRYKRSFAPGGVVPFFVGSRIFRKDLYDKLLLRKIHIEKSLGSGWKPRVEYVPAYRS